MSHRELKDFIKHGDAELGAPRFTGIARMRAMAGVPAPEDPLILSLSKDAAEWLAHVRAWRIGGELRSITSNTLVSCPFEMSHVRRD